MNQTAETPVWELPYSAIVDWAATRPISTAPIPARPAVYSEQAMEQWAYAARQAETVPPAVPFFPIGTWAKQVDTLGEELYQLREYPINSPLLTWSECKPDASDSQVAWWGKLHTVEKYQTWIADGSPVPPVHGVEHASDGTIHISDGHHRAIAAYRAGCPTIRVWVGITIGYRGVSHAQIVALHTAI